MTSSPEAPVTTGTHDCQFWQDADAFVEYHISNLENRRRIGDDCVPMLRPPFGHALLPAALGTRPELLNGELWMHPCLPDIQQYKNLCLPARSDWTDHVEQYYRRVLELAEGRFTVEFPQVPGPADLMGALLGYEAILLALHDTPEAVEKFARHAAGLAVEFVERIRSLLSGQEDFGGGWLANAWGPAKMIRFCEHTTVNYSPEHYERFILPANRILMENYDYAMTYIYYSGGKHLASHYLDRGCPTWMRSFDEDPPPDLVKAHRGRAIVTVHTTASDFQDVWKQYGNIGVCYLVECAALEEAVDLCESIGLRC